LASFMRSNFRQPYFGIIILEYLGLSKYNECDTRVIHPVFRNRMSKVIFNYPRAKLSDKSLRVDYYDSKGKKQEWNNDHGYVSRVTKIVKLVQIKLDNLTLTQ